MKQVFTDTQTVKNNNNNKKILRRCCLCLEKQNRVSRFSGEQQNALQWAAILHDSLDTIWMSSVHVWKNRGIKENKLFFFKKGIVSNAE